MSTRTNIVLDDELVNEAMARAGVKTKRAAVEAALRAFVRRPDYAGLLALAGTGTIAPDYDPRGSGSLRMGGAAAVVAEPPAAYVAPTARRASGGAAGQGKRPAAGVRGATGAGSQRGKRAA